MTAILKNLSHFLSLERCIKIQKSRPYCRSALSFHEKLFRKTLDRECNLKAVLKCKIVLVDRRILSCIAVIVVDLDSVAVVVVLDVAILDLSFIECNFLTVSLDRLKLYLEIVSVVLTWSFLISLRSACALVFFAVRRPMISTHITTQP